MTDDIDLLPFIGIQALSAAGRGMQIGFIKISRDLYE